MGSFNVAKNLNSTTKIVRMKKNVSKGTELTDDYIELVEVGVCNLPESVLRDKQDVIGRFASTDLFKDDFVMEDKLTSDKQVVPFANTLNGKKAAMSISIKSSAAGLSGNLEPGDIISIVTSGSNSMEVTQIPSELKYVKVVAVTGSPKDDVKKEDSGKDPNDINKDITSITVLVNQRQAEILAEAESNSNTHVVLVFRGDDEQSQKFLDKQDEFFLERKEGSKNEK